MLAVSVTRCLYGADFLGAVVESTEAIAERHIVLYTPVQTFTLHRSSMTNPDTRDALRSIADHAGGNRLDWREGLPISVTTAFSLYDADIVLELDADEIIEPSLCRDIIARYTRGELTAFSYRLSMLHFWRSFDYVCKDGNHPPRLYLPRNKGSNEGEFYPSGAGHILHMGYARRIPDMEYKISLSEHLNEFRPEWWTDIFTAFPKRLDDLHPISPQMWNAEAYDKRNLPGCLRRHPYYRLSEIA